MNNKVKTTPFEFVHKKADSLYTVALNNEYSDIEKMGNAGKQLQKLENDSTATLVGEYYFLLSNYYKKGNIKDLLTYYEKIEHKEEFEHIRLYIDFEYILNRYDSFDYEGAANRINNTLEYIHKEKYAIQRFVLINGVSNNSSLQEFKEQIKDIKLFIDKLDKNDWAWSHSKLYRIYAKALSRSQKNDKADEIYRFLIEQNEKHGILTEKIHSLVNYSAFFDRQQKSNPKKISSLQEAIQISTDINYTIYLPLCYRQLGHYSFNEKKFEEAYNNYSLAQESDATLSRGLGYSTDMIYKGWAYYKMNPEENYDKSLEYYELAIAASPNNIDTRVNAYKRRMWSLQGLKRKEEAKELIGEIKSLEAKAKAKEDSKKIIDYKNRLQLRFSDMNNRIEQLSISNELKDTRLRMQASFLILFLVLMLFFSFLVYTFRRRIKMMKEIENKNIIISQNNTKLKQTLELLELKGAELDSKNQRLTTILNRREKIISRLQRFASILAHDFKEPVRTIVSFGELLNSTIPDRLDEEELEFFNFVINSTRRLNVMVDRLYTYSNNTLALMNDFKMINLERVIRTVERDLAYKITEKQAQLKLAPISYEILGDNVLIYQLFQNLMSNALKFSKDDLPPIITIKNEIIDDHLVISILDNGVGIKKSPNTNIFALFSRTANTIDKEGHGLGLATCKEVVEIHGGKINYSSEIGIGTTFFVHFKEFKKIL